MEPVIISSSLFLFQIECIDLERWLLAIEVNQSVILYDTLMSNPRPSAAIRTGSRARPLPPITSSASLAQRIESGSMDISTTSSSLRQRPLVNIRQSSIDRSPMTKRNPPPVTPTTQRKILVDAARTRLPSCDRYVSERCSTVEDQTRPPLLLSRRERRLDSTPALPSIYRRMIIQNGVDQRALSRRSFPFTESATTRTRSRQCHKPHPSIDGTMPRSPLRMQH